MTRSNQSLAEAIHRAYIYKKESTVSKTNSALEV
jgi:hypothetical protein